MATTDVLLLKHVVKLGAEGEQVRVRAGYARNFLFPRKVAISLSCANVKQMEALKKVRAIREMEEKNAAQQLAEKLKEVKIAIAVKTGEEGKLFGSVTLQDVLQQLTAQGIQVERKALHLVHPIKALGRHVVEVKLHPEVVGELHVEVVSENPIVEKKTEERKDKHDKRKAPKKDHKAKDSTATEEAAPVA